MYIRSDLKDFPCLGKNSGQFRKCSSIPILLISKQEYYKYSKILSIDRLQFKFSYFQNRRKWGYQAKLVLKTPTIFPQWHERPEEK